MNAATGASPFVGPRPFERSQADLFEGREHEIERLEALVLSRRVVLFYAASGMGKSSLINAGLVPKLVRGERGVDCDVLGVVRVSAGTGSSSDGNVFSRSLLGQLEGGVNVLSLVEHLKNRYLARKLSESAPPSLPSWSSINLRSCSPPSRNVGETGSRS